MTTPWRAPPRSRSTSLDEIRSDRRLDLRLPPLKDYSSTSPSATLNQKIKKKSIQDGSVGILVLKPLARARGKGSCYVFAGGRQRIKVDRPGGEGLGSVRD
jgi:hypothetical protein